MELIRVRDNYWQLKSGGIHLVGSFREIVRYAVKNLRMNISQIEVGVLEMNRKDHNVAHFGVFGNFMFSTLEQVGKKAG